MLGMMLWVSIVRSVVLRLRIKNIKIRYCQSGVCADICVYFSIKDALEEGFACCLIEGAACALDADVYKNIKAELMSKGVQIANPSTANAFTYY